MMFQCAQGGPWLPLITAFFVGVNSALGLWLAHRRKGADSERRWFYHQMRVKHGLDHGGAMLTHVTRKKFQQ